MAYLGSISEFYTTQESWTSYVERLVQYLAANKIEDTDQQRAVLLYYIQSSMFLRASALLRRVCHPTRYVLNLIHAHSTDILLSEGYLPLKHPSYLTAVSKEEVKNTFEDQPICGIWPSNDRYYRCLTVVLSLQLSSDEVIPIPCILDTGAPGITNLGTGAISNEDLNVIQDRISRIVVSSDIERIPHKISDSFRSFTADQYN